MEERLAIKPQPWTGFLIEFSITPGDPPRESTERPGEQQILFLCPASEKNPAELCLALFGRQIVLRRIPAGETTWRDAKPAMAFIYSPTLVEQPGHLLRGWGDLDDAAVVLASKANAVRSARLVAAMVAAAAAPPVAQAAAAGRPSTGAAGQLEDQEIWEAPLPEIAMIDDDGNVVRAETNLTDYRAEYACRYVLAHFHENINRDQVAEMVHLSPGYFSNLFRAETGMSFSDYLIMVRIENAKAMLRRFELSVEAISKKSGFNSLAHFSRTFKDRCGISPLKFRKNPHTVS